MIPGGARAQARPSRGWRWRRRSRRTGTAKVDLIAGHGRDGRAAARRAGSTPADLWDEATVRRMARAPRAPCWPPPPPTPTTPICALPMIGGRGAADGGGGVEPHGRRARHRARAPPRSRRGRARTPGRAGRRRGGRDADLRGAGRARQPPRAPAAADGRGAGRARGRAAGALRRDGRRAAGGAQGGRRVRCRWTPPARRSAPRTCWASPGAAAVLTRAGAARPRPRRRRPRASRWTRRRRRWRRSRRTRRTVRGGSATTWRTSSSPPAPRASPRAWRAAPRAGEPAGVVPRGTRTGPRRPLRPRSAAPPST